VTREVRRLKGDLAGAGQNWDEVSEQWRRRVASTVTALGWARQAAAVSDDEDIHAFVRGLEMGEGFAGVVQALAEYRATGAAEALAAARAKLARLREHLAGLTLAPTDVLGGDPGCWEETLVALTEAAARGQ